MNILTVSQNYFVRGGSDRYFFGLNKLLREKGHQVIPFAGASEKNLPSEWAGFFPKAIDVKQPKTLELPSYFYNRNARKQLQRLLELNKIDIAHLNIYYGVLTSSILKELKSHNIPIVQTLHEYKLACPVYTCYRDQTLCTQCSDFRYYHAIKNRCNSNSIVKSTVSALESYISRALGSEQLIDQFITVSEFQRSILSGMGVPQDKMRTIHNFVDSEAFVDQSCKNKEGFLFAGRIELSKGVEDLIRLASSHQNTNFVVAGDGSAMPWLKEQIAQRKLSNIKIMGFLSQAELKKAISEAKACLVLSIWPEPFGLAVTESYAAGTPVVAYANGGPAELVQHGKTGFLVQPGNLGELGDAIAMLEDDSDLAIEMGSEAQKIVRNNFSTDSYYDQLMQVYKRSLGGQHA